MKRMLVAALLGLLALFLFFLVGETAGLLPAFIALGIYFFICEFLLARGRPDLWRRDWKVMLALVTCMVATCAVIAAVEDPEVVRTQGVGILVGTFGGTLAGALVAFLTSGRAASRA
jgi:hypothetical protein